MDALIEVLGWTGSVLLIVAYLLATKNIYPATTWQSLTMNLLGAVFLGINGFVHHAFPSVALNSIWVGIGLYGLLAATRSTSRNSAKDD